MYYSKYKNPWHRKNRRIAPELDYSTIAIDEENSNNAVKKPLKRRVGDNLIQSVKRTFLKEGGGNNE